MVTEDSILVISPEEDPHAISICSELRDAGKYYSVLQFGKISDCTITFRIDGNTFEAHAAAGLKKLIPGRINSVLWIKQPDVAPIKMAKRQDEIFATHEIRHCFSSLWAILNVKWVNFPGHIARASYLPEQLIKAKRLGARVVPYLLSNNRETLRSFVSEGSAIYEPFSALPPEITQSGTPNPRFALERYYAVECDTVQDLCLFNAHYPLFLRRISAKGRIRRYVTIGEKMFSFVSGHFDDVRSFEAVRKQKFEPARGDEEQIRVCAMMRSAYKLCFCVCNFLECGDVALFWGMVPSIEYLDWLSPRHASDIAKEIARELAADLTETMR